MLAVVTKTKRGTLEHSEDLRAVLQRFDGQEILVEISKLPMKRSERQNKYYFGLVVPYFQAIWKEAIGGLTKDMTHEMLKHNFLPMDIISPSTGKTVRICRSTRDLSTKEFSEYLDACRAYYLHETGEPIPLPYVLEYH